MASGYADCVHSLREPEGVKDEFSERTLKRRRVPPQETAPQRASLSALYRIALAWHEITEIPSGEMMPPKDAAPPNL
jgi:hypothetical protein